MYQQVIARRYAKGFLLAVPKNEREITLKELKEIVELFREQGDFYKLLTDPAFSPLEKKAVLNRIAEAIGLNETLKNFLLLLIEKGRASLLPLICDSLQAQIDEQNDLVRAKIMSATVIDADQIGQIKQALAKVSGKNVEVSAEVEPGLLGGIKVDMGGMIFDGTVKAKLDLIKNQLLNQMGS